MNRLHRMFSADPAGRRRLRRLLLIGGPLLALAAVAVVYTFGGRYVSSEDAYVKADKVAIAAEVDGRVVETDAHQNEPVRKGQVLFRIDDASYRLALTQAQAALDAVADGVQELRAQYQEKRAELAQARADTAYYQREFVRRQRLAARHVLSASDLDQAQHALKTAQLRAEALGHDLDGVLAQLGGDPDRPLAQRAAYQQARARRDQAALDLQYTVVRAPQAGIVGPFTVQVGDYVKSGDAQLSLLVPHPYVEANLKETELTFVRPGQSATVTVDAYPGRRWQARVASISPATGAEFSLLPAENATGNWVKVVQRVPVRLALTDPADGPALRSGMSASVTIDTGHRRSLLRFIDAVMAGTFRHQP